MPAKMTVAGPVTERAGHVLDRAADGVGEVAGELLDRRGQHDADEHRHERDHLRVAVDRQCPSPKPLKCGAGT